MQGENKRQRDSTFTLAKSFTRLHSRMLTEPTADPLEPVRRNRLASYVEKFGSPFPRPQIVKLAANFGMMGMLETMHQERADANEPVTDWNAFALELQKRLGR